MGDVDIIKLQKRLNYANMTLGVGILLTVIPLGYVLVSLATDQHLNLHSAYATYGWIMTVVIAFLPLGLALLITGLSLMTIVKRKIKAADVAKDDEEAAAVK